MESDTKPANPVLQNPYPYGFRDVEVVHPDGRRTWEMVPLTIEENLHPGEMDRLLQTPFHLKQVRYLANVFDFQATRQPNSLVCFDLATGEEMPDYVQLVRERQALERQTAEANVRRHLEARVAELETELQRLRGNPPTP